MSELDNSTDSTVVQKKISELEEVYKECAANLNKANNKVSEEEKKLLNCLQQLMPLQNAYLTSLIRLLQNQLNELKENPKKDNVTQPKVNKPVKSKLKPLAEVIEIDTDESEERKLYKKLNI